MIARLLAMFIAVILISSCAHVRPDEVAGCKIDAYPLLVGAHHPRDFGAPESAAATDSATGYFGLAEDAKGRTKIPSSFEEEFIRTLARAPRDLNGAAGADYLLVLSGGGQHGPFGTGFYLGLKSVPTYRIVTGVSTGALQSTFMFLANQPVAHDRVYPADIGRDRAMPADAEQDIRLEPGASNLGDLALASSISSEKALLKVNPLGLVGGVVAGAATSLDPLRARLFGLISPETLHALAAERAKGRRLYVGIVDLDDGNGYALDLTALASRVVNAGTPAGVDALRHCYAEALIASSSVPLAAFPVSLTLRDRSLGPDAPLKRHMVIDGGARFGVFVRQVLNAAEKADVARNAQSSPTNVDLIVNGGLYTSPWHDGRGRPIRKWSALSVGLRAVDILENQVYRFSVEQVEGAPLSGGKLRMAFISNENLGADAKDPDQFAYAGKTCGQWSDQDERQYHVTQFHPRYMACLLAYGHSRGLADQWNIGKP